MIPTSKLEFYDDFVCTGGSCSFTCCEGWEIAVDEDTYLKWKNSSWKSGCLSENITTKKSRTKKELHTIKMGPHKSCSFLNEEGLCSVVIECGEEFIPATCRTFPRLENRFGRLKEYSLSCACPSVVDMINGLEGKIKFTYAGNDSALEHMPAEYQIRAAMITIMQENAYSLKDRMLIAFEMLLELKQEPVPTGNKIETYLNKDYLKNLVGSWSGIKADGLESFMEINELFLDISENYRKEPAYSYYLEDIANLAEELESAHVYQAREAFDEVFAQYGRLLENCMVSKIFGGCVSRKLDEIIMFYQMLVAEYLMVRHSALLLWQINGKEMLGYSDIRDFIMVYSRMIGYNAEGVREFWESGYDEAIWEFGYMQLLLS